MKKILLVFILLVLSTVVFADRESMITFKKTSLEIIYFLNNEQNKETFTKVNFKMPSKSIAIKKNFKPAIKQFVSQKYDFSNKTPYGDFKVLVFEDEKSFKVSFSSEYPIQQFQLMDSTTKNISVKEELNDAMNYSFILNRSFEPKYILLLSMYKDGIITQNIIPLYNKVNVKTK